MFKQLKAFLTGVILPEGVDEDQIEEFVRAFNRGESK